LEFCRVLRRSEKALRPAGGCFSNQSIEFGLFVLVVIGECARECQLISLATQMIEKGVRISDTAKRSNWLCEKRPGLYGLTANAAISLRQHARGENRQVANYLLKGVPYGGQILSLVSSCNNQAVSARQAA